MTARLAPTADLAMEVVPSRDSLGDRMKGHEAVQRTILPPRSFGVLRVDGRAFHTWTRGLERPFDALLARAMDETAEALCKEVQGAVLAFVQSDEISVIYTDFSHDGTQPWFGGVVQKQASIAASVATARFNRCLIHRSTPPRAATFDARVFTVPAKVEVANYLIWRQRDAIRNSVAMAAQAVFSHRELQGANTGQMKAMLTDRGIDWADYPARFRQGGIVVKRSGERQITYFDKRDCHEHTTTAIRSWWETSGAPYFTVQTLDALIPDREPSEETARETGGVQS